MKRRLLVLLLGVVVAGAMVVGAWQVAYARGEAAGRAAVMSARAEFLQSRSGPGAGGVPAGDAATPAGKPGGEFRGGQGGRTGGGAAQADNSRTAVPGTVEAIEGTRLTLTTDAGPVTVTVGEQTQVRRQVAASIGDLKAGDRVLVTGARAADGAVTAATVQIQGQ